jgi:hypothetical protein
MMTDVMDRELAAMDAAGVGFFLAGMLFGGAIVWGVCQAMNC